MFRVRNAVVAVAVVGAMLTAVQGSRAQSSAAEKAAKLVCQAVMWAARPSTIDQEIHVVSFGAKIVDDRRIDFNFVVNWKGYVTGAKYQTHFTVQTYVKGGKIEVLGVRYRDNAKSLLPHNQRNIDRALPLINKLLDSLPR